jgi:hypothetical protein
MPPPPAAQQDGGGSLASGGSFGTITTAVGATQPQPRAPRGTLSSSLDAAVAALAFSGLDGDGGGGAGGGSGGGGEDADGAAVGTVARGLLRSSASDSFVRRYYRPD